MIFICEFSSFRRFLVFTDSEAVSDTDNSTAGYNRQFQYNLRQSPILHQLYTNAQQYLQVS